MPISASIQANGQDLAIWKPEAGAKWRVSCDLVFNEQETEFLLSVKWPDSTEPAATDGAVEVSVAPKYLETKAQTFWAHGELVELLQFSWAKEKSSQEVKK